MKFTTRRAQQSIESRRRFLVRALAMGWLAGGSGWNGAALAQAFGQMPRKLPEGKSIFELKGEVLVNGRPATTATVIGPSDTIRTGPGGRFIGVVGKDAVLLREKSELQLGRAAGTAVKQFFRVVTGAMLSVFGPRRGEDELEIRAPAATIGIRGTGVYTEVEPTRSYLCTCYGQTQIVAAADATATETIRATHHDAAKWILMQPEAGKLIVPAPFQNHDDLELMTLEALVGREVPFAIPGDQYERPRRDY
jgi:hypothetical protein